MARPRPSSKSWSFAHSTYSSPYLSFDPVELSFHRTGESQTPGPATGYVPISTLSPADRHLIDTYDSTAVGGGAGTVPFIDIANKEVVVGASADPAPLEGLSLGQISSNLSDPSSPVGQHLDGAANALIANICALVGTQRASICSAPFVQETHLGQAHTSGSTSLGTASATHLVTRLTEPGPDGSTITLQTSSPNMDTGCLHLLVTDPTQPSGTGITTCSSEATATHPPTTTTPSTSFGSGTQPWMSPSGHSYVIVFGQAPLGTTSVKLINGPTGTVVTGNVPVSDRFYAFPAPQNLTHTRDELAFYGATGNRDGTAAL
jgi:hypothetical protein